MSDHRIETCTRSGCDRVAVAFYINGALCSQHYTGHKGPPLTPTNYPPEVVAAYEQGRSDAALSLSELCLAFEDRAHAREGLK